MRVCFLGATAYAGRVDFSGWPVPPDLCEPELAARSYQIQLDQYQLADELGFDWVSISEHHFSPRLMTPNPIVFAGAVSQRIKRAKIAVLGPLMPLVNPVRLAEELAMLDSISEGRLIALFLRGTPVEQFTYSTDGQPMPNTREITQEATLLVLKAWRERQPFSWHSEHFDFEHVSVWPRPLQDPHPPVLYSGNSKESAEFAAKHHLNLAIGFAPPAVVKDHVDFYKEKAAEAGWAPTHENVLYRARTLVAPDDEQALEVVERARRAAAERAAQAGEGPSRAAGDGGGSPNDAAFQFYGTPQTIVDQIKPYHEAGVGILDLAFAPVAFGRGGTVKSLNAFADVLPTIQAM